ncbi:flagellar biosynthesis protein FlhB [Chelatococcus daeguensis]|uniref:Flagellar biosynthetic protein FlhB n=2 Tax=Chelatococcus TaxID=28209 RepID=A0AAC9NZW8_9HYPH|nr:MULTISPECIES: flagellar biosynthesis protein FlhB [Chelatococcus]APF38465.1 flagellar biosynthesis protein FlhB [Chelatococcus daeguensis]KZE34246.1 flagellar biosynthetic protein FlhB [Chelatococcus daeguensis]MBM3083163.1 flagellar biosynthesis protein FlhB [Chelatococcus daeguensis]CUA85134.1 flagellar biosynthetic protein FlhB [Chelatococcus sambhunathii]
MAEQPDQDSKTEEPTEKKVRDALDKGNVPYSRETSIFASLGAILIAFSFLTRDNGAQLGERLTRLIDTPGGFSLANGHDASVLMQAVAWDAGQFVLPIVIVIAIAGTCASLFQNAPRVVGERIRPKWQRISPTAGFKRIFGKQGFVEFFKSLFKFTVVGLACLILLGSEQSRAINAMFTDPSLLPETLLTIALRLVSAVCVATILLVAADLVWARLRWHRELRMTRQEVKDEFKQAEGDPLIKSRMRSMALDQSRKRMMASVPMATVVITNPTHFAVALRYVREEGGAPLVVAKGQDLIALRIREIATQHDIPIIEDKPLARALYDAAEVDRMIPPEFFKAVAQVLYYVYTREGGNGAQPRPHSMDRPLLK